MHSSRLLTQAKPRRGLAPLELVLSLPLLLAVAALFVGLGAAASWKIRTQVNARQRVWSDRWPRAGAFNPRPTNWPQQAPLEVVTAPPLTSIDLEPLQAPVVRGPLGGQIVVDDTLFDPALQVIEGHAHLERRPPLLPRLGAYELDVRHDLLDRRWQYRQMGLVSNTQRRIPRIYDLPEGQGQAAYLAAYNAILNSPQRSAWAVLDRDEELATFYGHYFDFHPRLRDFCSLDVEQVRSSGVNPLIDRIQSRKPPRPVPGVPERLTRTFLQRYRAELALLNAPGATPNPARAAQLQGLIAMLEGYLEAVRAG